MSDSPSEKPRRGRIILPGEEAHAAPGPKGAAAGGPAGAPGEGSRIVLPPGVSRDEHDDVPEFPKLRPLILMPLRDGERELLVVSDPLGVTPGQPVLAIEALGLMQLFDGSTSVNDITSALMRENKDIRMGTVVKDFVRQLDELLLLDSPRFHKALQALRDAYHPLEIRQAVFEGRSYPADPEQLRANLDAHFEAAEQMRSAEANGDSRGNGSTAGGLPRAVMAPHLDPRRTGRIIARAVLELDGHESDAKEPLRVVVFGTGHSLLDETFALTRKHFETPLGRVQCDTAFVDAMAEELGEFAYRGELAHRDEHSIEFIAVYLRHRFGDHVKIVPILVGGFHGLIGEGMKPADDAGLEKLLETIRETEGRLGGKTVYLSAVDFSHVGPRFGDPAVDERTREEVDAKDRAAISAAEKGDAEAWFEAIAAHDDSTRICGFGPTYAMLRAARPPKGRLLHYERSEEPDGSFVSVAAMVWR